MGSFNHIRNLVTLTFTIKTNFILFYSNFSGKNFISREKTLRQNPIWHQAWCSYQKVPTDEYKRNFWGFITIVVNYESFENFLYEFAFDRKIFFLFVMKTYSTNNPCDYLSRPANLQLLIIEFLKQILVPDNFFSFLKMKSKLLKVLIQEEQKRCSKRFTAKNLSGYFDNQLKISTPSQINSHAGVWSL